MCGNGTGKTGTARGEGGGLRGFTFTISVIILSITLIAMAAFSKEWSKNQQSAFIDVLPQYEALRVLDRVSADMANLLGASALVERTNASSADIYLSVRFPLKKEGFPVADMKSYSRGLSESLRPLGLEAILFADNLSSANPRAMLIGSNGSLFLSNDGPNDTAVFIAPSGWLLAGSAIKISCSKAAYAIGEFALQNGSAPSGALPLRLEYYDMGGAYLRTANMSEGSNLSLKIAYLDGSTLAIRRENGSFSFSMAKSPGACLVLPFDSNASSAAGAVRDYSPFQNNMTLGNATAPAWTADGKLGGAYRFNGAGSNISLPSLSLTETAVSFSSPNRVSNGGFESINASGWPANWTYSGTGSANVTNVSHTGAYAFNMTSSNGVAASQTVSPLVENTEYTLEFWSQGTGRYRITANNGTSLYLQADRSWGASTYHFITPSTAGYAKNSLPFMLPWNANSATITFVYPPSGTVFYDDVSLSSSAGFNGGFESAYKDSGANYNGLNFWPDGPG